MITSLCYAIKIKHSKQLEGLYFKKLSNMLNR